MHLIRIGTGTDLAGYPANLKARYLISGETGYRYLVKQDIRYPAGFFVFYILMSQKNN
jgi:hypothetical protein